MEIKFPLRIYEYCYYKLADVMRRQDYNNTICIMIDPGTLQLNFKPQV